MKRTFGYARISRSTQSIDRQIRNIKGAYPDAVIYQEAYTGTRVQGRKEFEKLMKVVRPGDCIVFDSVSRMSRNADEGMELYEKLMQAGIELVFLKEPTINTAVYAESLKDAIPMTGTDVDLILQGVNAFLKQLRRNQIKIAFDQAEKEVKDLHERTAEGIETARRSGKQIGGVTGKKLNVKKAAAAKAVILQHSKTFGGSLADAECQKLCGISRNSFYLYKRQLVEEQNA